MIHATVDLEQMVEWISQQLHLEAGENGCLAVLHNRNDMPSALNSSDWVVNSGREGYRERCHIMCRNDSTARAACTNEKLAFSKGVEDTTSKNFPLLLERVGLSQC